MNHNELVYSQPNANTVENQEGTKGEENDGDQLDDPIKDVNQSKN
mgnify:CR=1 FL=1